MPVKLSGGDAVPGETEKLFVLAGGFQGVGKSSFACSFPSPLWIYNFDRPITPIIKLLPKHYEINYESFTSDVDGVSTQVAKGVLNSFNTFLNQAIADGKKREADGLCPGTFIIDGSDLFWEIVKMAKLPEKAPGEEALPREFADANTYMMQVLRRLHIGSPLQVCLTAMAQNIWGGAKQETQRVKNGGFKHVGRYLTHELYMFAPEGHAAPMELPQPAAKPGQTHHAYVMQSKINESLVGSVIANPSFRLLWRSVYGSAHPESENLWMPGKAA